MMIILNFICPLDTGAKLSVHKKFRSCPGSFSERHMYIQFALWPGSKEILLVSWRQFTIVLWKFVF